MPSFFYIITFFGVIALLFTFIKSVWINRKDPGTDKMKKIASHISESTMAFLKSEYKVLPFFVIYVAILLTVSADLHNSSPFVAVSFIVGAVCSALTGLIGMKVATKANVRTTNAVRTGLSKALEIAFTGGSVIGMAVVGLGILGLGVLFVIYGELFGVDSATNLNRVITVITGFSFGASSIALFARVGGGIYTKVAVLGDTVVDPIKDTSGPSLNILIKLMAVILLVIAPLIK